MLRLGGCQGSGLFCVVVPLTIAVAEICGAAPVLAQTNAPPADGSQTQYGWREIYSGVDAARDQWLAYSGMTIAPWGRDIYTDGWRFRLGGGYGRYGYDALLRVGIVGTPSRMISAREKGATSNISRSSIPMPRRFLDIIFS